MDNECLYRVLWQSRYFSLDQSDGMSFSSMDKYDPTTVWFTNFAQIHWNKVWYIHGSNHSTISLWHWWSAAHSDCLIPSMVIVLWCTTTPQCADQLSNTCPSWAQNSQTISIRTQTWSHPDAPIQDSGSIYPPLLQVSLLVCGKRAVCVAPAPSKSSSGRKHWRDTPLEPPCDSPAPLSPSPPSETTWAGAKREDEAGLVETRICSTNWLWVLVSESNINLKFHQHVFEIKKLTQTQT